MKEIEKFDNLSEKDTRYVKLLLILKNMALCGMIFFVGAVYGFIACLHSL